jgi:ABC-2 type transport system permease protein
MKVQRILTVTKYLFKRLHHDRRTIGMIVMMPIIFMVLFGTTFSGEPNNVPTIVVNLDQGVSLDATTLRYLAPILGSKNTSSQDTESTNLPPDVTITRCFSTEVVEQLKEDNTLRITESTDLNWAKGELEEGRAAAVLYFPPDYTVGRLLTMIQLIGQGTFPQGFSLTAALGIEDPTIVSSSAILYADKANPQVHSAVVQVINGVFLEEMKQSIHLGDTMKFMDIINIYGEDAQFIDFFAPGIMVIAVTMITIILTIISFVRERNNGTLARLFSSPMTADELVTGYALGFGIIATGQSIELLAIGILMFQIHIVGSVLLALVVIILLAFGVLGLGILLSTIAKNEYQAVQFVPLVIIPAIILSGVFWPIESMPPLIKPISDCIPMTYAVDGLRSVMVRGWDAVQIWPQILVLVLFAIGTISLAMVVMRKKSQNF